MAYDVRGTIDSDGATFFVKLSHIRIAMLNASPFRDNDLYINRVNVPKEHRGRGIGSALMQAFLESARQVGVKRIFVEPGGYQLKDQPRRVRWYEEHGFIRQDSGFYEGSYVLDLTQQGTT